MKKLVNAMLFLAALVAGFGAWAQDLGSDFKLGAGDIIRIVVFQNPDLTLETRIAESGAITYPLIGTAQVGGLTIDAAEKRIAQALKDGGFVQQPQVNIVLVQNRGSQISVTGQVNRPGRYPLETFNTRVSEMLATAGGIAPGGADTVILSGMRNGKQFRKVIDIPAIYLDNRVEDDVMLAGGDALYVHRAPVFYIYGEVQRPGSYRIERAMTVQQALAQGGGPTARGTEHWLRLHRRMPDGKIEQISPERTDHVQPDDVLYIRESIF